MSGAFEGPAGSRVISIGDGVSAPVSNVSRGRLRYNDTTKRWEYSVDTGPWLPFTGTGGDPTKEIFYIADTVANDGSYRVRNIGSAGAFRFDFKVPHDFSSLVSLVLVGWPESGAAGPGKDIDLTSEYGAVGEARNQHSESDTTSTYDLGSTDVIFELDISGVFSVLAANDYAGVLVDHNGVGGVVHYLGIRLRYN
jgi:hypothetical protein